MMTDYTEVLEQLLHEAIVDGETEVIDGDGQYRLVLANRAAWLYQGDRLVHRADLDADMLGDQVPAFMSRVGF